MDLLCRRARTPGPAFIALEIGSQSIHFYALGVSLVLVYFTSISAAMKEYA